MQAALVVDDLKGGEEDEDFHLDKGVHRTRYLSHMLKLFFLKKEDEDIFESDFESTGR